MALKPYTPLKAGALLVLGLAMLAGCQSVQDALSPAPTETPAPTLTPTTAPTPTARKIDEPGDYRSTITLDDTTRSFIVHIPPGYSIDEPLPLVINLHGRTSNMFQQMEFSGLAEKADEEMFLVASPQALGDTPTWFGAAPGPGGEDDLYFLQALLDHLQKKLSVDPARIYITGLSNGATFANRLACVYSDQIAAIAPVAGGHIGFQDCEADNPVAVVAFHGKQDEIIPYEGNEINPPVRDWVTAWAERNNCQDEPREDEPAPNVLEETWQNCDEKATVKLYTLDDVGHAWPGSDAYSPGGGASQTSVDATDLMWEFFENHPRQ